MASNGGELTARLETKSFFLSLSILEGSRATIILYACIIERAQEIHFSI